MSFSRCIGIAFDEETAPRKQRLFVAAIDFGTAYSGYAFSSKAEPLKIHTNVWNAETNHLLSAKAPTTLLLSPKGEFQAFGYDAETKYTEMSEKGNDFCSYYYFHCFKMMLQCENVSQ